MNRTSLLAALALAALAAGPSPALAQQAGKPDLAKAKEIATTLCAACHGADGNSPTAANPNLAGQGAEYISRQLEHFKAGIRVNPVMQGMVATLTPADMTALGIYFSQQKPQGGTARDAKLVLQGQSLYRGGDTARGLPACAACHLPTGAGIPKNFPRLSSQHADYTYAQLKAFKSGERGANAKDTQGSIMADVAARMTDTQMKAVADYTSGLR
ncbi:MAG: cytochrome c4 [Burkholderiales bacterium]|nr:cytochrome c4 [Burkholderiales bacterium]